MTIEARPDPVPADLPRGVLARLRAAYPSLPEAERRVAAAIEAGAAEVVHLPIRRLAARIGVSETTIIRLCQALGYRGLRELKLALAAEVMTPQQLIHEDIQPGDDVLTIAAKVLRSDIQAITDTLAILDRAMLERAVAALLGATRVEICGVGASVPVALDAYYRFLRIGLPVTLATDPLMQAVSATHLPPGAVALAISHTGRTRMTLAALRRARAAGATCILLTSYTGTPLGRLADIELVTASRETAFRTDARASRIAHLSLIDALYVALAMRQGQPARAAFARSNDVVEAALVDP